MRRNLQRALGLLGLASLVFAVSCNRIQGSCDQRASGQCEEILASTIKGSAESKCTSSTTATEKGTWSTKGCDHTGALAACESNLSRVWYYPSARISKVEQVAELCTAAKLLDAKGKELKDVKPEKLGDGPGSDPALDKAVASTASLEATVAAIEKIKLPGSGGPSGIKPTGGKRVSAGAVVYEHDLATFADRAAPYEKTMPLKDGDDFHACGIAVRGKDRQGKTDADLARVLTWCASLPYLLVVRATKLEQPATRTGSDFITGRAEGHVFVYELPSGKAVGGYPFNAESSAKVKLSELDNDFRLNFAKALTAGLVKADPGATLVIQVDPSRN